MSATSLDFSERRDLRWLSPVIASVQSAAIDIPSLLVGATARDLLLLHAHGIDTVRATNDVDLAISVPDWDTVHRLRGALLSSGEFSPGPARHALYFRDRDRVDLIPFGALEQPYRRIAWPPDGGEAMGVLGLSEALQAAINVRLPENVDVQVAALPALAVLKVAAWYDRQHESPGKDAGDLWLLLRSYASAGNEDRIYEGHVRVLESSGFDPDLAGAWLMGADALRVMQLGPEPSQAIAVLRRILDPEVDVDGPLRLLGQMPIGDKDRQLALLRAFRAGLLGVSTP